MRSLSSRPSSYPEPPTTRRSSGGGPIEYFQRGVVAILLDSAARWSEGEPRRPVEWQRAGQLAEGGRVILSAGLTPDNVAQAVSIARPYAVDVNSGVEAVPGRKDPAKVRRFVTEAQQAG